MLGGLCCQNVAEALDMGLEVVGVEAIAEGIGDQAGGAVEQRINFDQTVFSQGVACGDEIDDRL